MKLKIGLVFIALLLIQTSCQINIPKDTETDKKGMVKVTILYPNAEGKTFDMDYYTNNHMPMVAELLGDALKKVAIDEGIAGRTPEDAVPYLAIGYLYFDTLADYQEAFGPHAEQIVSDITNYTNIQPVLQISEILQ